MAPSHSPTFGQDLNSRADPRHAEPTTTSRADAEGTITTVLPLAAARNEGVGRHAECNAASPSFVTA
jgi:hypothetical protein